MGCGCIDTADGGNAALVPSERLASWLFDLQDDFIGDVYNDCRTQTLATTVFDTDAVQQPAPNAAPGGGPFALTPAQRMELQSELATLAVGVPGVVSSTTQYSFPASNACAVADGG
jgi:hypothetical protein